MFIIVKIEHEGVKQSNVQRIFNNILYTAFQLLGAKLLKHVS